MKRNNWQITVLLAGAFWRTFAGKMTVAVTALLLMAVVSVWFGLLAGTAAEWFAAAGTIFAAATALNIAAKDRIERRGERDAADLAQVRLVVIEVRQTSTRDSQLRVLLTNFGQRPILRALVLSAELETLSGDLFQLGDPTPSVVRIVPTVDQPPELQSKPIYITMRNERGELWEPDLEGQRRGWTEVRIQCLDADGNNWILSNQNDPQRDTPEPSPPWYVRVWRNRGRFRPWLRYRAGTVVMSRPLRRIVTALVIALLLWVLYRQWDSLAHYLLGGQQPTTEIDRGEAPQLD
jgi:hypothetical protein